MNEVARMHIAKMHLMLDERLRMELTKPGFWGNVSLNVGIENQNISTFKVGSEETIRTKPL